MAYNAKVNKHTIVLMHVAPSHTRTYRDFESISDAMIGLCSQFEEKLKRERKGARNITYDIKDLFAYIDGLHDIGVLTFEPKIGGYLPHDREWVKHRLYKHLQRLAQGQ